MKSPRRERGLTLVEVLVASTIFSLISLTAYVLIFRAQATHEQLDADVVQQRTVRFALDRIAVTLRSAGSGVNPAGDPSISDEAIEGAWESALFVRADFDGERETLLEGTGPGERHLVTTGNDEIVGFVLGKSGTLPHAVTLQADLTGSGGRRDATLEDGLPANEEIRAVSVSATSLAEQTDPPYQLVRVTFNTAGDAVREVVADNIFRLRFRYFDRDGAELSATELGGADGTAGSARLARAEIRRVEIELVGMSERPVSNYRDPVAWTPDPPSAGSHRKFRLTATVELGNVGLSGRDHGPVPSASVAVPEAITACPGHCDRIVVTWPAVAGVQAYQVMVNGGGSSSVHDVVGETSFVYRAEEHEAAYTFAVRSWDPVHNVFSAYSPPVSVTPSHELPANTPGSVPAAPSVVHAAPDYALSVAWNRAGENVDSLSPGSCVVSDGFTANPLPPFDRRLIDLETYEVHRVRAEVGSAFSPGDDTRVDDLHPNIGPMTALRFTDHRASPCQSYFYRVRAVDACGVFGAASPAMTLPAEFDIPSGVSPEAPSALHSNPPVKESVSGGAEVYVVSLEWPEVTSTAPPDAKQVAVAHYIVERSRKLAGAADFSYDGRIDVYETNRVVDIVPKVVSAREATYHYVVRAQFDCTMSGLRTSEPSPVLEVPLP